MSVSSFIMLLIVFVANKRAYCCGSMKAKKFSYEISGRRRDCRITRSRHVKLVFIAHRRQVDYLRRLAATRRRSGARFRCHECQHTNCQQPQHSATLTLKPTIPNSAGDRPRRTNYIDCPVQPTIDLRTYQSRSSVRDSICSYGTEIC